jgi:hypothetical protein
MNITKANMLTTLKLFSRLVSSILRFVEKVSETKWMVAQELAGSGSTVSAGWCSHKLV